MNTHSRFTRRRFLGQSAVTGIGLGYLARLQLAPAICAEEAPSVEPDLIRGIVDPEIRAGLQAAVFKNLIPAATERVYPGHFTINADGGGYGSETTWPGLDSWQMIGPYLQLGRTRLVLDYFEFVRASQRADGNIPFAIFTGETQPGGCLRGLKHPDDVFTYRPPKRDGLAASSQETRQWIGLFEHWQTKGFPLGALAPVCYVLTAAEIFDASRSRAWLQERLGSVEAAAKFLLTLRTDSGLIGGSGFYIEAPPREGCDGVAQCYAVHAFRQLARLCQAVDEPVRGVEWTGHAAGLAKRFNEFFWRDDHFGEYLHPERGLVDAHGLSDVNWAAVAFGLADNRQLDRVWPRLVGEPAFWAGDMPTQLVTRPFAYEPWEFRRSQDCPADPLNDVAAMGRVWYVEAMACRRMKAHTRLVESVRKVCRAAQNEGYWRERYHLKPDGSFSADGSQKYCEYAAVLARVVFANREIFYGANV
ncbi:MAG: hypothetical protein FJ387_26390 [Verrucomicrobia bacterium]|nr:hypothetical protein [Verrucomicrobiota bacterium]